MALLLRDASSPPGCLPVAGPPPMTPEEVAESYTRAEATAVPTPGRTGKRRTAPGKRRPGGLPRRRVDPGG
jgi:hypothetical protein